MTNVEQESPVQAPLPLKTFITSVARIQQLAHPFRRVTFRGGDLVHFSSIGPDQFVYLLLPPVGRTDLTIDSSFGWDQYQAMPESERPIGAYYTVRRHRPETAELDIDIVNHGRGGQVAAWLERARPGDPAALWGPRMAYNPPPNTGGQLLIGDETAIPAIAAICAARPIGELVTVMVELDQRTILDLSGRDALTLIRFAKTADGSSKLPAAIRSHQLPSDIYVWGAGEFGLMRELRAYLRECVGLRSEQVSMVGYWRRGSD